MALSSGSHNVYLSVKFFTEKESNSPSTSTLSIRVEVSKVYRSDSSGGIGISRRFDSLEYFNRAISKRKELKDLCGSRTFQFQRNSLTWYDVSRMISGMNIPFQLDRLHWRGNPIEDWTLLADQDDIVRCILDFARDKECKVSNTVPMSLMMGLSIKQGIVLPHSEFEAMAYASRLEEQSRAVNPTVSHWTYQPQAGVSMYILRSSFERRLRESSGNVKGRARHSSLESLIETAIRQSTTEGKSVPAAKSAIEGLKEVIYDGQDSIGSCAICLEVIAIGSSVTGMPCSHKFHKTCILLWLDMSHICPLCRFKLPTI